MSSTSEAERERVARSLVEEATERFAGVVPANVLDDIRTLLELELLCTESGAELLRSVMPDPVVEQSGAVAKDGEAAEDERASADRKASG